MTPLKLAALEVCLESYEKVLDNADDVIHGTYAPRIIVLEPVYWSPWCCPEGMRQALLTALPSVMKAVAELSV